VANGPNIFQMLLVYKIIEGDVIPQLFLDVSRELLIVASKIDYENCCLQSQSAECK